MVTELVAQRRGQQWLPLLTDRTRREGGSAAEARRPQEARAGARIVLPGAAHASTWQGRSGACGQDERHSERQQQRGRIGSACSSRTWRAGVVACVSV
jgi:hypothetical protein